ncbi:MAG: RHS repeat-associated core domain-containing protein [Armatimonadota bacterium]
MIVSLFLSALFIGAHQLNFASAKKTFSPFLGSTPPAKNAALASLLAPGPPNLSVSLEGFIRNIDPHFNSVPGVEGLELQRWTPTDTGWVAAGSIGSPSYFGDGRRYDMYQGPGSEEGGTYQYRARYVYYDTFGVLQTTGWASDSVTWTSSGPTPPHDSSAPGDGCGQPNPKSGGAPNNCGDEGRAADPVNLATGYESYRPKPDLSVYNPIGPDVVFQRTYNELSNLQNEGGSGLPLGWSHNYDVLANFDPTLGGWGDVLLRFPGGSRLKLEPVLSGGAATGAFLRPAGSPFVATGVPSTTTVGAWTSITIKWTDETIWTLSASTSSSLRLSRITVKTGQYIDLQWTGEFLQTVKNQTGATLLTLIYSGGPTNLIVESRDSYARSTYYSFDAFSRLLNVSQVVTTGTSGPPVKATYGYTTTGARSSGLLSSIVVPSPAGGTATSMASVNYNSANSRVQSLVDAHGNAVFYTYGANSTLVQHKDSLGNIALQYTQKFDSLKRNSGITDALGKSTLFEYLDSSNPTRPTKITDRDGRITLMAYDAFGNQTSVTTPRPVTTIFSYDYTNWPTGRLVQIQRGTDNPATISYFTNGLVNTVTTATPGATTGTVNISFTYDGLGNVLTKTVPGNNAVTTATTTFSYTADGAYTQAAALGQPIRVTDPNANVRRFRYDSQGRVTSAFDPINAQTNVTYNIVGKPLQITLPATGQTGIGNGTVVNAYLWPDGPQSSTTTFNESGVQVKQVSRNYGDEGEVLSVVGNTELSTYVYDALYRVKSMSDGNGNATTYLYNSVGRLSQMTMPGGNVEQYPSYDGEGRVLQRIEPRGRIINYTYNDPEGRLTLIDYPLTPTDNAGFTYDSYGRLQSRSDGQGSYQYTYGRQDEVLTETTSYTGIKPVTLTRGYYPDGSQSGLVTPLGNFTYNYDAGSRPTSMVNPFAETTSWSYFADSSLNQWTYPNGSKSNYTYNALGQLTSLLSRNSTNTTLSSFTAFTYNGVGNLLSQALSVPALTTYGGTNTYTYNSKDELLTSVSARGGGFSHSYMNDNAGNLTTLRGAAKTYDAKNQLTGTGYVYDAAGNPTTYATKVQTFDTENRLKTSGTYSAGYRSDNLRAWKQVGTVKVFFIYDGGTLLYEVASNSTPTTLIISAANTFGSSGLVSRRTTTNTTVGLPTSGTSTFYLFDERGNTIQRLNSSQAILSHHRTDAYGLTTTNVAVANDPFVGMGAQYGYYYESSLGMFCLTNRYYDPTNARFLTRDPISYSGGMNLYGYVGGNPIMRVDPSGTDWDPAGLGRIINRLTNESAENIREFWADKGNIGIGVATVATTVNDFFGHAASGILTMGTALGEYSGGCGSGWAATLDGVNIALFAFAALPGAAVSAEAQAGEHAVYAAFKEGEVAYIGRSINIRVRESQHIYDERDFGGLKALFKNLTLEESKLLEQATIEKYGIDNLQNMRNSIAKNNPLYKKVDSVRHKVK